MTPLIGSRRGRGRPLRGRRQMRTRRRWTWRSFFRAPIPQLVVLVVVLAGLYALATSRVFAITRVQVVGDSRLPVSLLQRTCDCLDANIFLTRPDAVRRSLERIPWLDVRQVYARLPDRVVIDASYRRPILLWRTSMASYAVDATGRVLYDLSRPPVPAAMVPTTATAPIVYNAHDSTLPIGGRVSAMAAQMVLQTRTDLAPDIAPSVDRYRWSPYSGLTAHSRLGWWFALGFYQGDALRVRLNALEVAYRDKLMTQRHCNYVDLQPLPYAYCNYQLQWHWPWGPGSLPALPVRPRHR